MAAIEPQGQKLKAGEHFGSVFHKYRLPSAIISESVYRRSVCLPEHSHELGFFTLIINGGYSEVVSRRNVVYMPKTVLWRNAEISHKDRIESDSSRFFFVEIDGGFLRNMGSSAKFPERLTEQQGMLTWLASRLRNEIVRGEDCSPLIAEGIALEMLGHLSRTERTPESRPPKWLRKVVERLNEEFTESLSSEELAHEAGVHPVYMASAFRKYYRETIGDYVQKLRVDRAAELLQKKDLPLAEIAYLCGFADQSHLTRIFRRRMGITPGAYRANLD